MQVFNGIPPVSAGRRAVLRQLAGMATWVLYEQGDPRPRFSLGSRSERVFYAVHPSSGSDDTAVLQSYIDALPPEGVLDGGGLSFIVTSLALKSNITIRNILLTTKAGAPDFSSPITIGRYNSVASISNIKIQNVHIDGNRTNQTNIGTAEDGGRHGIRIIGYVSDVEIDGCSARYCATDGICIFTGNNNKKSWPRFSSIMVKNCTFNGNRRHGGSADSIMGMQFIDCELNGNGLDLPGVVESTPTNHGQRGATAYGSLYGNGFDVETYGSGHQFRNVAFVRCVAIQNYRAGILFYEIAPQKNADFIPSRGITIDGCTLDKGISDVNLFGLDFTSTVDNKTGPSVMADLTISGNTISGQLNLRCVENVTISGGSITTSVSRLGNADNARSVIVSKDVLRAGKVFEAFMSSITYEA